MGHLEQVLADRLGWDSLTQTVEQVYAGLPPAQRAQACVLTSNYGEAGALSPAGRARSPPAGHQRSQQLLPVGTGHVYRPGAHRRWVFARRLQSTYADVTLAATQRCQYCVSFEQDLPIVVASNPTIPIDLAQLWPSVKHYD